MADRSLYDRRILVTEDEYLLAIELCGELEDRGAMVLGPLGRLQRVLELIEREAAIDGAVLDANLGGELVYPAADLLASRDVPFVFVTGYDASAIPTRFEQAPRCEKPFDIGELMRTLERIMRAERR